ncbi:MAG: ABC transporter ATP-binding protein [Hyphomicrobiaceae bacterium]
MPKLSVEGLKVTYGPIVGTEAVSFVVEPGETVALIGSNGAGKSSTLKAILGMVTYEGLITFGDQTLRGLKPSHAMRLGIGFSPEGRRVFPQLTVLDNLRVGGISRPEAELPERIERIYEYFPRLKERRTQAAGSLSGGEQQMLAIGRALMSKPSLIMLDEPSLGLAPVIVERIGEVLSEIQKTEGLSVLLAEQNATWALSHARRAVILDLGRIRMTGSAEKLLDDPEVRRAYLGI